MRNVASRWLSVWYINSDRIILKLHVRMKNDMEDLYPTANGKNILKKLKLYDIYMYNDKSKNLF